MSTAEHTAKIHRLLDVTAVCAHAVKFIGDIRETDRESLVLHIASLLESVQNDAWDIADVIRKASSQDCGGAS